MVVSREATKGRHSVCKYAPQHVPADLRHLSPVLCVRSSPSTRTHHRRLSPNSERTTAGDDGDKGNADDGEQEEEEEPSAKVEIKGNDDCDILFTGRAKMAVKGDEGEYDGGVVGTLTLRRAKASSQCWVQVNGQTVRRCRRRGTRS